MSDTDAEKREIVERLRAQQNEADRFADITLSVANRTYYRGVANDFKEAADEIERLRRPQEARSEALEACLQGIAKQELSPDMTVDQQLDGDFEGAYNHMIELARRALATGDEDAG